jgi:hypothetical protein
MKVVGVLICLIGLMASCQEDQMGPDVAVEAEVGNMREIFHWLTIYKNNHKQAWPQQNGQAFLLELWNSEVVEKSEKNARRYFSAAEPFSEYLMIMGMNFPAQTCVEYLNGLDGEFGFVINYASFDSQEDAEVLERLQTDPASVTIMANATFAHLGVIYYMTGDGTVKELSIDELLAAGQLNQYDLDSGIVPVGRNSPVVELRTVTTN